MPTLRRVVKRRRAATAFDGRAAQRLGGRWNSPGSRTVYASGSKSLALLEVLVHLDFGGSLPRLVSYSFDARGEQIDSFATALPRDWRRPSGVIATQAIGDRWLESARALALAVPSTIVPEESNFLLNPDHPGFSRLQIGKPIPFLLDTRLRA